MIRNGARGPRISHLLAATWGAVGLGASGCNVYRLFEAPNSDDRRLSAARGCLDRGDYSCAASYYGQVTGAQAEVATTEKALALLAQQGVGLSVIAQATVAMTGASGSVAGGKFLTSIASSLVGQNTGSAKRRAIYQAYQLTSSITTTATLRGLVRFTSSAALAAELLAEAGSTAGSFKQTDYVLDPTSCTACGASCDKPASSVLSTGANSLSLTAPDANLTAALAATDPDLQLLHAALQELNASTTELGLGGPSGNAGAFASDVTAAALATGPPDSPCYRERLLINGIGN